MAIEERYAASLRDRPHGSLQIQQVVCNSTQTLVLTGELDMASCPALDAALVHVWSEGTSAVVLDLRKLKFMDSTGIRAVLMTQALCAEHGCELRLLPGPLQVQRAFEICGLIDQLPFRDDAERSGEPEAFASGMLATNTPPVRRERPMGGDS